MGQWVPPGKSMIFFSKSKLKTVELVARPDGMQAGGMNEHDGQAMEAGGAFGLGTGSDPEHADVAPTVAAVAPFADRFPLQVTIIKYFLRLDIVHDEMAKLEPNGVATSEFFGPD